jgi:hypothetical protein
MLPQVIKAQGGSVLASERDILVMESDAHSFFLSHLQEYRVHIHRADALTCVLKK